MIRSRSLRLLCSPKWSDDKIVSLFNKKGASHRFTQKTCKGGCWLTGFDRLVRTRTLFSAEAQKREKRHELGPLLLWCRVKCNWHWHTNNSRPILCKVVCVWTSSHCSIQFSSCLLILIHQIHDNHQSRGYNLSKSSLSNLNTLENQ